MHESKTRIQTLQVAFNQTWISRLSWTRRKYWIGGRYISRRPKLLMLTWLQNETLKATWRDLFKVVESDEDAAASDILVDGISNPQPRSRSCEQVLAAIISCFPQVNFILNVQRRATKLSSSESNSKRHLSRPEMFSLGWALASSAFDWKSNRNAMPLVRTLLSLLRQ